MSPIRIAWVTLLCVLWSQIQCSVIRPNEESIKCLVFNEADTLINRNANSNDPNYEDDLDEEKIVDCLGYCFAVWINDTNQRIVKKKKGCLDSGNRNEADSKCLSSAKFSNLLFCNCNKDLCNSELFYDATLLKEPLEKIDLIKEETFELSISVLILIVILLIFLMVVLIYGKSKMCHFNQIPQYDARSPSDVIVDKLFPIQLIEVKAKGRFGEVWKALNQVTNHYVAVKIVPAREKHSWLTEQEIFKLPHMNHENILQFIGAEKHYENISLKYWLITAYHEKGSLCDYLKNNTVTWENLCKISFTMASGLAHLHDEIPLRTNQSYKPPIAHRDFKSNNVLLKDNLTACIADFGLALIFQNSQCDNKKHGQVGTRRYMAPEVLEGSISFSTISFQRVDIYACGLVLWEILCRCTAHEDAVLPYHLPFQAELGEHPTMEDMLTFVARNGQRPVLKDSWRNHPLLSGICNTIEECWDPEAEARISASCIADRFYWNLNMPS